MKLTSTSLDVVSLLIGNPQFKHLGFTGSSTRVSGKQLRTCRELFGVIQPLTFHHGDCIKADEMAHNIIVGLNQKEFVTPCLIHVHPPTNSGKRSMCQGATVVHACKPYLVRNMDIVNASDLMVAVSDSNMEKLRSGTWSTVRKGVKKGILVLVVYPDGSLAIAEKD